MRRSLRAVVLCLLVLVPATPSLAARPLPTGIPSILRSYGLASGGTGVTIVNLSDGQVAYRYHAWTKLAPASNEKLVTTVAALSTLRPGFRYETALSGSGERTGATYHGDVFLVGAGDPTLSSGGLKTLARRLRQNGILHIDGRILGDESIFDQMRFGPQWKTSFYGTESPPLSGLTVDRNTRPNGQMVAHPALSAARLMRRALIDQGITVAGGAATGKAAFGTAELVSVRSKPLWMILRTMDRTSDNFMAEMVIKAVGALGGGKGTTAGGLAVAQSVLEQTIGEDARNLHLVDGSGLSAANRLTASALAELLARTSQDATLGPPLRQALAVAGVNGTLRDRPAGAGHRVLAKTGTLDGVSSLSGYATTQSGARFAFSILMNGRSLSELQAHEAQDKIAALVAAQP